MNFAQIYRQWLFYLNHSLRDLARNGSRTVFALFCIGTGVAAVVALRSLAFMIGDELTTNLAEINRGDIQIAASRDLNPDYYQDGSQDGRVFTPAGMAAFRTWASKENVEVQFASTINFIQILPVADDSSLQTPFAVTAILIDPATWPFYGEVFSVEPAAL